MAKTKFQNTDLRGGDAGGTDQSCTDWAPNTKPQVAIAGNREPGDWSVLKFGGTSVANVDAICQAMSHVSQSAAGAEGRPVVVVSALGGVTDRLLALAGVQGAPPMALINDLVDRHECTARALLQRGQRRLFSRRLKRDAFRLSCLLAQPQRDRDQIVAFGELWSARLFAAALSAHGLAGGLPKGLGGSFVDARRFLRCAADGTVDYAQSKRRLDHLLARRGDAIPVITGFIAADPNGRTVTLGRNGSDFSATLVASFLNARGITIFSDVEGVLSADPDRIDAPVRLPTLSFEQADRLARLGARVLHPRCIEPLRAAGIGLRVESTFTHNSPGTQIGELPGAAVCGLVCHEAERLQWLPTTSANYSGADPVRPQFQLDRGLLNTAGPSRLRVRAAGGKPAPLAVLAIALSQRMADQVESLTRNLLDLLAAAGIQAQACDCHEVRSSISVALLPGQLRQAAKLVHQRLFQPAQQISIGLVGAGRVGSRLLQLVEQQQASLRLKEDLDLRICAVANSRTMLLGATGIDAEHWTAAENVENTDAEKLRSFLARQANPVWVDATASGSMAELVEQVQDSGITVVTANKLAATVPLDRFSARCRHRSTFLHGTTVAAGVPILECAESLVRGGEKIISVRATLSGSLSWILAQVNAGESFSVAVEKAQQLGLTEPDPREDLGGADVARKLVILGRHLGLPLELDEVSVEGLLPGDWQTLSQTEFWSRLGQLDAQLALRQKANQASGKRLCYVARIDQAGKATASLLDLNRDDRLIRAADGDNVIETRTTHYADNPLVLQGPGAGVEVTAAGLLSDVLMLTELGIHNPVEDIRRVSLRAA